MTLSALLAIPTAYAAGIVNAPKVSGFDQPSGVLTYLILQACNAATWIFAAAIILSIIFTLLAGIDYMRSSGDPAKVKSATQRLVFAAVGVAVALIAFTFPTVVSTFLSVPIGSAC